jgi:processing peptidase subunit beta
MALLSCWSVKYRNLSFFCQLYKNVTGQQCRNVRLHAAPSVGYRDALLVPETNITTLKNNLRVATEDNQGLNTATVGVWIQAGSRHENDNNNGVANLLQHLAFKGSKSRSELDIETEAELHGIQLSAQSSREITSIRATCLPEHVPKAVELLADAVVFNSLNDGEIDRARNALIRQLQNVELDSNLVMMDYLYATAYQQTPMAKSALGTTESLRSLTAKEVRNFAGTFYKAPRMVLCGAGCVDHSEMVSLGEKYFSDPVLSSTENFNTRRCRFTGSELRARYDDLPLAHVAIAVEAPPFADADSLAMKVAQIVVGKWDRTNYAGKNLSTRLGSACSQLELCLNYDSFYSKYSDTALWGLRFVADRLTIEDMIYNVQGEWMRLCSSLTEFEVERAKNQLKTKLMTRLSSPHTTCNALAREALYFSSTAARGELDAGLHHLSAQDVRDACMQFLYDKCPAVVGLGPVEALPDYNRVRGAMWWLRL